MPPKAGIAEKVPTRSGRFIISASAAPHLSLFMHSPAKGLQCSGDKVERKLVFAICNDGSGGQPAFPSRWESFRWCMLVLPPPPPPPPPHPAATHATATTAAPPLGSPAPRGHGRRSRGHRRVPRSPLPQEEALTPRPRGNKPRGGARPGLPPAPSLSRRASSGVPRGRWRRGSQAATLAVPPGDSPDTTGAARSPGSP